MNETKSAGGTHNVIAGETTIVGKIIASQDIRIDGVLEGRLECQGRVIVGTNGKFGEMWLPRVPMLLVV